MGAQLQEPFTMSAQSLSKEENIALRAQLISKSCGIHFENDPLKVVRAQQQYLYCDLGFEYLDCINCVAHVGHCHPKVVAAGLKAMSQMGNISTGFNETTNEYIKKLKATLPTELDTFLFVSSGAEASDLAVRLSRMYSGGYDVVAAERSFHGSLNITSHISTRQLVNPNDGSSTGLPQEWVHVLPCPDLYRGKYKENDPLAVRRYCEEAKLVIQKAVDSKRKLACFICEPLMTIAGIILPPTEWMHYVYKEIRSHGGLAIADETQTGLGRCGKSFWSFQCHENLIPDIITIGKPLGNGHPMAVVVTRSSIAARLGSESLESFKCDAVSSAIGLAVIDTVRSESLQQNAKIVGSFLKEGLRALSTQHPNIGDVRGTGFMIGAEIVFNKSSRKPATNLAEKICYMLKEQNIIMANEGVNKNVLLMMPPMCFTYENAHRVITALDKILKTLEAESNDQNQNNASEAVESTVTARRLVEVGILDRNGYPEDDFLDDIGQTYDKIEFDFAGMD